MGASLRATKSFAYRLHAGIIIPQMNDIREQIESIEKEIRETPYHKGTEHHIGKLRARRARLLDKELGLETKKTGGGGGGYAVKKQGDATVVLVGPPSAGKSTLINKLTNAESKVAAYAFTTVSVIPGMLKYKDAYIQILDVPGLLEGASGGKGRGKEVISVARGANLLIVMTDVARLDYLGKIKQELFKCGIRLDCLPPLIKVSKKTKGGINVTTNLKQDLSNATIAEMAREFGINNADIVLKQKVSYEDVIDALSGNRVYIPTLSLANKIDLDNHYDTIYYHSDILGISCEKDIGLTELKKAIWSKLGFIRVYLVGADEKPNFASPVVAKKSDTLGDIEQKLSSDLVERKKLAKIWGASARFPGQEVPLSTPALDGMQVRFV